MSIIIVPVLAVFLCTSLGAIIDVLRRPSEAFVAVGESKPTWIILIAIFTLFLGFGGFIVSLVYLFFIRPKVRKGPSESLMKMAPDLGRSWTYFALWILVGGAYAMVIAGAFTIGIFFLPIAIIGTIFLTRGPSSRRGVPGLIAGLAFPVLYVAYLNRGGPGYVCTTSPGAGGSVTSCASQYSPWLLLGAGLTLLGAGVGAFVITSRSKRGRRCPGCQQPLDAEGRFCPFCGIPAS